MTLNQIKQEIAALLKVDSVNAKSLFELANCNPLVLAAIQVIDASQFNLRTTKTWQALLDYLCGGVNESLSSDVAGVTGNTLNSLEVPTSYKGFNYNPKNQQVTLNNVLIGLCLPVGSIVATETNKELRDSYHSLYCIWNWTCWICFKRYILMPHQSADDYIKLLSIHLEATTGYKSA